VADVSGALSDVSLNTKLPYLIPHLPVLQTADCTRGGGVLRPPERFPPPTIQGPSALLWSAVPGTRLLSFGGLCATVLHLLRRGIFDTFIHRTNDLRITSESCAKYTISRAINQSTVRAAKLSSDRRNPSSFVSLYALVYHLRY
jgi:hypothetical protein